LIGLFNIDAEQNKFYNLECRKPSAAKAGSWNRKREGLSLFSILNRCKTVNGVRYLRNMLRSCPRNLDIIRDRQNAVDYFAKPDKMDLVKTFQVQNGRRGEFKSKKGEGYIVIRVTCVKKVNNVNNIKSSRSKLVSARLSVLSPRDTLNRLKKMHQL
jgi:hypothetical protein